LSAVMLVTQHSRVLYPRADALLHGVTLHAVVLSMSLSVGAWVCLYVHKRKRYRPT